MYNKMYTGISARAHREMYKEKKFNLSNVMCVS